MLNIFSWCLLATHRTLKYALQTEKTLFSNYQCSVSSKIMKKKRRETQMIVISDPFSLHIIFFKLVSSEFLSGEEKTENFSYCL